MPYSNSFARSPTGYPISPKNEWYDYEYMDETDTLLYEQTFIDMITGESNNVHLESNDEILLLSNNSSISTATRKPLVFNTDLSIESHREWQRKNVQHWSANDIMDWIISVADDHNYKYEHIHMPSFNVDGLTMCNMTETEFLSRSPEFGRTLFLAMENLKEGHGCNRLTSQLPAFVQSFCTDVEKSSPFAMREESHTLTMLNDNENQYIVLDNIQSEAISDAESESSIVPPPPPIKRLPGRPRGTRTKKKPEKRCGRLWEFIRDLLLNREYCPSLICWDDYENGVFRFVHSEKVARLWGTIKENPKMTYEKLSRAMRYYYKSKVLQPVLGRRLVYKFGPTATGWRTPNPNFRLAE